MDNIVEGSETMNIQKFTQKSIEAVNDCEKLAYDYGNQEIEQEHLLVALLSQEDGLIPKLIDKIVDEINTGHFGDGKIFVYDVEDAIRIRTGEHGTKAL